jgi:hypothetical protein
MIFNHNHTMLNHQKIYDGALLVTLNDSMDPVQVVFILSFLCCNLFLNPMGIINFIFGNLLRFI